MNECSPSEQAAEAAFSAADPTVLIHLESGSMMHHAASLMHHDAKMNMLPLGIISLGITCHHDPLYMSFQPVFPFTCLRDFRFLKKRYTYLHLTTKGSLYNIK